MAETIMGAGMTLPGIRPITMDSPWEWLAKGWDDFLRAPAISLAYGAVFTIVGFLLAFGLWEFGLFYLVMPLAGGYMLVAPVLGVGLYEVSRRLAAGEQVRLGSCLEGCLSAVRRTQGQISLMAGFLLILLFFWMWIALLIFMLFYGVRTPAPDTLLSEVFFQPQSVPFLVVGAAAGAAIAALVFAVSAISVPMLVDREVSIVTAVATSFTAVSRHWQPMALWAGLIAVFTIAGVVTLFIGLAVTMPLVGYATWHAYKAIVE